MGEGGWRRVQVFRSAPDRGGGVSGVSRTVMAGELQWSRQGGGGGGGGSSVNWTVGEKGK